MTSSPMQTLVNSIRALTMGKSINTKLGKVYIVKTDKIKVYLEEPAFTIELYECGNLLTELNNLTEEEDTLNVISGVNL